jgi:predicted aminopeptidase
MHQGVACDDPLLGIVVKHAHQQVVALVVKQVARDSVNVSEIAAWRILFQLVEDMNVGQLREARPHLVIRCTQHSKHLVDHLNVAQTLKQRLELYHLEEDASD